MRAGLWIGGIVVGRYNIASDRWTQILGKGLISQDLSLSSISATAAFVGVDTPFAAIAWLVYLACKTGLLATTASLAMHGYDLLNCATWLGPIHAEVKSQNSTFRGISLLPMPSLNQSNSIGDFQQLSILCLYTNSDIYTI